MQQSPTAKDEKYMRRCLQLARYGVQTARPNPMVGAVIVANDRIIGEGYHHRAGEGHAEVNAFASVSAEDEKLLHDATIYVSLEPCSHYGKTPPCCDLIIKKGVRRVVAACEDPFPKVSGSGIKRLRDAGIAVEVGLLADESRWLNRRFLTFHAKHRPYILLKWAQTANGLIDDNGKPLQISTPFTSVMMHRLRAEYAAILVGRVTDEREHPQLTVRHWSGASPERIVLSRENGIDEILANLYKREVQSLMVEGGAMTLQSFISRGLFDEIRVEIAPFSVEKGTKAPEIPQGLKERTRETIDGRTIVTFSVQ